MNVKRIKTGIIYFILLMLLLHGLCGTALAQDSSATLEGVEVVSRHTFSDVIPSQTLNAKQLERLTLQHVKPMEDELRDVKARLVYNDLLTSATLNYR